MPNREHPANRMVDQEAGRLRELEREAEEAMKRNPPPGYRKAEPAEMFRLYRDGKLPPAEVARIRRESYATDDDPEGVMAFMDDLERHGDA